MTPAVMLHCPRCRRPLWARNESRVFLCTACMKAFILSKEMMRGFALHAVAPGQPQQRSAFYVPFWRLMVTGKAETGQPVFVAARFVQRWDYYGDLGMVLTRNRFQPQYETLRDYPILSADRELEQAANYAMVYRLKDPAGAEAAAKDQRSISIVSAGLLLVPFFVHEDKAEDALLGWRYPAWIFNKG